MAKVKIFNNGLTLIVDEMQSYESVAFNMLVKTGSISENESNFGISHFIEHMLFKGTKTRSAFDIVSTLDSVGANVNAYTDKEETTFFTKSTAEHLETCTEILSDMLFNSVFEKKELMREKKVVLEEIKMFADDPYLRCENLADKTLYFGTPYGFDVAGTRKSVMALTKEKILKYMSEFYTPSNIILSFAGKINEEKAIELTNKYFLNNFKKTDFKIEPKIYQITKKISYLKSKKENEQAQVCIDFPGVYANDKNRHVLKVVETIFGQGMSSRLFQRIREKMGLVYSISCESNTNNAGGDVLIRFATSTINVPLALFAIAEEIKKAKSEGFLGEEFQSAKNNVISEIKLKFENTAFVSLKNAKSMASHQTVFTKAELIDFYQQISLDDVNNLMKQLFNKTCFCMCYVGSDLKINLKKHFKL